MSASEPLGQSDVVGKGSPVVVVGVDGSEGSAKALAWAAQEARMRGATLRIVHAWHFPRLSDAAYLQASTPAQPSGFASDDTAYDEFRARVIGAAGGEPGDAEASVVVAQIAAVLGASPDVPLERHVKQGRAPQVILEAAKDADLVVVGSRGRGGFTGLLLGSVSSQVAQHSHCPVTVVH
jgi:nucleotide-binding universal stress UspA family protein